MNFRFTKQRASHSETHAKKSDNPIHLSQFFSRPGNDSMNKNNNIYYDPSQKQNKNPNTEPQSNNDKQKQRGDKITPKKKVIHLKSIARNSKSNKNGHSGSMDKKYYIDHPYMEVADFSEDYIANRPSITIDVDLKSHRRSMQDTLVSSNTVNQVNMKKQQISCCMHIGKKATFMVKGSPYCDKCSVKLITKGLLAIKIKQQKEIKNSRINELYIKNQKQTRDYELKSFIEQLDKMQPILQQIGSKLNSYTGWINQYCLFQYDKFQQNWSKFIKYLQDYKKHIITNFKAQEQKANKILQQTKIKIKQQTCNLTFMRNDIVRNIDRIIDQKIIPDQNYHQVMKNFKQQLQQIHLNVLDIQKYNLILPTVQFDPYQLDQQLHNFLFIKPFAEQLFSIQNVQTPLASSTRKNSDPYRLSFGKQPDRIQSPTFKVI